MKLGKVGQSGAKWGKLQRKVVKGGKVWPSAGKGSKVWLSVRECSVVWKIGENLAKLAEMCQSGPRLGESQGKVAK